MAAQIHYAVTSVYNVFTLAGTLELTQNVRGDAKGKVGGGAYAFGFFHGAGEDTSSTQEVVCVRTSAESVLVVKGISTACAGPGRLLHSDFRSVPDWFEVPGT